jgi:2-oxoisovalerate dehydrogenase E1 component alpha subunit
MRRGFSLQQFADQCFSNSSDLGKGRQMPIHYGSRALNYQTISPPLGTQIPQAAGAAYKLKLEGKQAVTACFFGMHSNKYGISLFGEYRLKSNLSLSVLFFRRL